MQIHLLENDQAILAELGNRLAKRRIEMGLTQADLAEQAGIGKRTVERIESGGSAQMSGVVRILRVLDLLAELDQLVPPPSPSPIELLRNKGKVRKRASSTRYKVKSPPTEWVWKEDAPES